MLRLLWLLRLRQLLRLLRLLRLGRLLRLLRLLRQLRLLQLLRPLQVVFCFGSGPAEPFGKTPPGQLARRRTLDSGILARRGSCRGPFLSITWYCDRHIIPQNVPMFAA